MASEPETILYALPSEMTADKAPILLHSAKLVCGSDHHSAKVRLEIGILSDRKILDMKAEISTADEVEYNISSVNSRYGYSILDKAERAVVWEIPVSEHTVWFALERIGILFDDRSYWVGRGAQFFQVPQPEPIPADKIDLEKYQKKTTEKSRYVLSDYKGLWRCSCGHINAGDTCRGCGLDKIYLEACYEDSVIRIPCPACSRSIPGEMKYCPYCGEEILEWKFRRMELKREKEEPPQQEKPVETFAKAKRLVAEEYQRPWWFWMVLIVALAIGIATIVSIQRSGKGSELVDPSALIQAAESPLEQIQGKAREQAEVEFGTGQYEVIADKDKKILYVNGWPEKAYTDLNSARMDEEDGQTQWRIWKETVTSNCETLRRTMDEKGYEDWGCSWSIRSNRSRDNVLLTIFDGQVLYDDLEH